MKTLFAMSLVSIAFAQTSLPPDLKDRSFNCSTQRVTVTDNNGSKHYQYRALLHGVRADGDKWEQKLGLRPTEKQATKDCQLWQEMTAAEKRKAGK